MVRVAGRDVVVVRPRDAAELIDEEAFAHDEFLPYWAELWPSSLALARAVATTPPAGLRVIELGCGLALPSIVAALCGAARVLATDWSEDALGFARLNAARNGAQVETRLLDWRCAEAAGEWDLVLCSDLLYERRNVEPLLALLLRLAPEVLLAEPGRPHASAFLDRASTSWVVDALADRVYRLRRG